MDLGFEVQEYHNRAGTM